MSIWTILNFILSVLPLSGAFARYHLWDKLKGFCKGEVIFSPERVLSEIKKMHEDITQKTEFCPEIIVGIGGGKYVGGVIVAHFLASSKIGFGVLPVTSLELVRDDNVQMLLKVAIQKV